jgi:hypothetical protein
VERTAGTWKLTLKVAVADLSASMVSWQVGVVPLQAPDQLPKAEPVVGVAVSVTDVPLV